MSAALDRLLERLDKPGRPSRRRGVSPRQMSQLMSDDGPQLSLGEHSKKRQPDQEGTRPTPGHHTAARKIGQADLRRRLDAQATADFFNSRKKKRRIDPGQNRTKIAIGIVGLVLEPDPAQSADDVGPAIDLVAGANPARRVQNRRRQAMSTNR